MDLVRHSLAALSAAAGLPLALGGLALRPAWRRGLGERLGAVPAAVPGGVWVHGASVGEIRAATGLIDALRDAGEAVAASTTTITGRDVLRRLRPDVSCGLAPLDHPWCVDAALRRVAPSALVLIETELWPTWIAAAHRRGIPVMIASGRISDRSLPRYRRVARLLRPTLGRLAAIGARTEVDADRFVALGASRDRVEVTGDLKLEPPSDAARLSPDLESALGDTLLFVAGSTHEGEEQAALAVLAAVEATGREAVLTLAPRHPNRTEAVLSLCQRAGRSVRKRSRLGAGVLRPGEVLLVDTLGELAGLYAHAAVAFVGGSLVPVGGHNVLEPIQQGCPVVFGPHTENATEGAALALRTGAGRRVTDTEEMTRVVLCFLEDPEAARSGAERGRQALLLHRGATERTMDLLRRVREGADPREGKGDQGEGGLVRDAGPSRRTGPAPGA